MGRGATGAAERALIVIANRLIGQHALGSMETWDLVGAELADRFGYKGEGWHSLIRERGAEKIPSKAAVVNSWGYASTGTALGRWLLTSRERCGNGPMQKFQKKSGNLGMMLERISGQSHPRERAMSKRKTRRTRTSWSIADKLGRTYIQS